MNRDLALAILQGHRYSSSPWFCTCGTGLDNAELHHHIADVLTEADEPANIPHTHLDDLGRQWEWCGGTPGTWEWRITDWGSHPDARDALRWLHG